MHSDFSFNKIMRHSAAAQLSSCVRCDGTHHRDIAVSSAMVLADVGRLSLSSY